jgi:outer membrane putative beta-barrel porin/alpha-amylase
MNFDSLDGVNLHNFPTVFIQNVDAGGSPCDPIHVNNCGPFGHDYIAAFNRIDLKINQYTAFATFGISKHIDLSVAVPVLNVSMAAAANSNFVYNSGRPGLLSFGANAQPGWPGSNGVCLAGSSGPPPTDLTMTNEYCVQALYSNSNRSSGIGDMTIRLKGTLKNWERSGFAAGIDVRVPTGDEKNFLGTGAIGVKRFAIWSLSGRLSPHVNVGYEWNGKSILAGDVVTGSKDNLPAEVLYSAGIEAGITRRLTGTLDLLGQAVINGTRLQLTNVLVPGICDDSIRCSNPLPPGQQPAVQGTKGTYAMDNASLGLWFRPFGKFLITASVQLKLDNGGLRSNAIPMVSATYTIR